MDTKFYTQNLTNKIIAHVENCSNKNDIISVVLTGSLGRDEGTFHVDTKTQELVLDSDVELALIYKHGKKSSAEIIKQSLIDAFAEELNPMTISEARICKGYNFNYSFFAPKYHSIFMYDFYNGSRTIWGEDLLDKKSCKYDKFEAKRIVANRIGELICVKNDMNSTNSQIKQWEGKLLLAIVSAYCILNDAYTSRYEDQYNFIIANKENVAAHFGNSFLNDYIMAFRYLRKGCGTYSVPSEHLPKYVEAINILLTKQNCDVPKINSASRRLKYMISCIKHKCKLNPFTCETTIINNLINFFISNNSELLTTSLYWKNILY